MIVIGITGGVGAGKSTVLQYLANHFSAHIIQADQVAKDLMQPGGATYRPLVSLLGKDILAADGTIDRAAMAKTMYASTELVQAVNKIVHPLVKQAITEELTQLTPQPVIAVIEAALLEEGDLISLCDSVWYIHATKEIRMERLISSRGYSPEQCISIINQQKSDAAFAALSDFIIDNGRSEKETYDQIRHHIAVLTETEV